MPPLFCQACTGRSGLALPVLKRFHMHKERRFVPVSLFFYLSDGRNDLCPDRDVTDDERTKGSFKIHKNDRLYSSKNHSMQHFFYCFIN